MIYNFSVTVGELSAIQLLAGDDPSRFILIGVYVEIQAGGVLLVATNGRALGVLRSTGESEGNTAFVIPKAIVERTAKKLKGNTLLDGEYDEETGRIRLSCVTALFAVEGYSIDGGYPSWRQVVPGTSSQALNAFAINPELVTRFWKISKALGRENGLNMRHAETVKTKTEAGEECEGGPIEISIIGVPEFYGLIMPMKSDGTIHKPEWLTQKDAPKQTRVQKLELAEA